MRRFYQHALLLSRKDSRPLFLFSRIRTDGWRGYSDTALAGYKHSVRIVGVPERAHQQAPHIHRVFSNLTTWLLGTHHGVKPKYLQSYLDEHVFRFTDGSISNPSWDFQPETSIDPPRTGITGVKGISISCHMGLNWCTARSRVP